ncbi:MAG: alkene reductase [Myxococcales bacterium FL481]|nr:MAG: alkene reductase [Myxococcales bacterium FL481]
MPNLFDSIQLGSHLLPNRVFMAPMTRGRATEAYVPTPAMATYYEQRASAGLLITEGVQVSPQGVGWYRAPGIWSQAMVDAWRPVTAAVHDAGGRVYMQLWHLGRVSHPDYQAGAALPVGPSAVAAAGDSHTPTGKKPYVVPRALAVEELPAVVDSFAQAARNAISAGFDGVEIHGANGYLLDQFIRDGSNKRDDAYGGALPNRWRLPLEVAAAVAAAIGPERTGFRVSPTNGYNDMHDGDPVGTFRFGAEQLSKLGLVYLHVVEPVPGHMLAAADGTQTLGALRQAFDGVLITNGGFGRDNGHEIVSSGAADAVAFGVPFLANPDLVQRFRIGAELAAPDMAKLYAGDDSGYIDYPPMSQ